MSPRLVMSPVERAALADALRHMKRAGVRPVDLMRSTGAPRRLVQSITGTPRDMIRKAARP